MIMRAVRLVAGTVFSTAIGFLLMTLVWQVCSEPSALLLSSVLALVVAAMYASFTVAAELNWPATLSGGVLGTVALGLVWSVGGPSPPVPAAVLIPMTIATTTAAAFVELVPGRGYIRFFSRARFVSLVHLLQGVFLFGALLPACLAWTWPRPFAAALICSAFVLWEVWHDCPLNIAENKLRMLEGKAAIPHDQGFTSHLLAQWGMPVSDKAVTAGLHALGVSLCIWWGMDYAMV